MQEVLVKMEHIDKSFPGVRALDDAQFELRSGEVHALVGENGAGKSTLMKILAGIYHKDAGETLYQGKSVEIPSPRAAQDLGICMIHQELNLMSHLTLAQNIYIGREPCGRAGFTLDEKQINKQTEELFETMHLKLDPRTKVSELSVAKQQMVEIAKALSFNSQVLIMDEPTAALTDTEIDDLFGIIRKLRANGVGIVYISHRLEELKQITDQITVMRDGRYIDTVATDAVTIDQIISMMVGRTIFEAAPELPEHPSQEIVLEVKNLNKGRALKDVNFDLKKGEILGFAGLMGAGRTEVARAIFGADPIDSGEFYINGQLTQIKSPGDAVRNGIGYLSEDRKQFGLAQGMDVETNIVLASFGNFLNAKLLVNNSKDPEDRSTLCRRPLDQDAEPGATGQESFRRQPAESCHRQVADRRHRHSDLRRADARHRCRRQKRNLSPAQRSGAAGQIDHHDLLGVAGDFAHEPPHRGHVRRAHHRRALLGRGDTRGDHDLCHHAQQCRKRKRVFSCQF